MVKKAKETKTITVVKDRDLIMMSNNISLTQRKLFNGLLYYAMKCLQKNKKQTTFNIDVTTLHNLTNVDVNNKEQLKAELKGLMTTIVEFIRPNDDRYFKMSVLLSQVDYDKGFIDYTLTPLICEMLIKPPRHFAILDLIAIGSFNSKFTVALYEYIRTTPEYIPKLEIKELRKLLTGDDKLYPDFRNFKKDVLNNAVNEINKTTDYNVTYELIKHRQYYTHIQFNVECLDSLGSVAVGGSGVKYLSDDITKELITELSKGDNLNSFKMRYDDYPLKFQIQDKELVIISPIEFFTQWIKDNHFDNKTKNILHTKFDLIFDKVQVITRTTDKITDDKKTRQNRINKQD